MTKDINILDLQALLEVFNEYDEFEKDLNKLLNKKNGMNTLYKIRELANGEKPLCSRTIKLFYKKHKNIIQKIHNIVNIQSFIYHSIDWSKKTNIYKYLDTHRDELDKMKEVVLKLKCLGVDKIEFDETFGSEAELHPQNIINERRFEVHTPDVSIKVNPERSDLIETRIIGGVKYILICADEDVEVNGVSIHIHDNSVEE